MASGPNIMLTATAVSFATDWYNHPDRLPNFRILMAGGLFSLFVAALADVNDGAARGLASIAFVTVMFSEQHDGPSPIETLLDISGGSPNGSTGNKRKGHHAAR